MKRDLFPATRMIKEFEGFSPRPYLCPAGHWTIGYGHVLIDKKGRALIGSTNREVALSIYPSGITQSDAEDLLSKDIERFSGGVEKLLEVEVNNNQFCALVSFAYNVGLGAFRKSTLLRMLNEGRLDQVPIQMMRWTRAGGKELPGLRRRRHAERALWSS